MSHKHALKHDVESHIHSDMCEYLTKCHLYTFKSPGYKCLHRWYKCKLRKQYRIEEKELE